MSSYLIDANLPRFPQIDPQARRISPTDYRDLVDQVVRFYGTTLPADARLTLRSLGTTGKKARSRVLVTFAQGASRTRPVARESFTFQKSGPSYQLHYILAKNAENALVRNTRLTWNDSGRISRILRRDGNRQTLSTIEVARKGTLDVYLLDRDRLGRVDGTPLSLVFKRALRHERSGAR